MISVNCTNCGAKFNRLAKNVKRSDQSFCSRACYFASIRGKARGSSISVQQVSIIFGSPDSARECLSRMTRQEVTDKYKISYDKAKRWEKALKIKYVLECAKCGTRDRNKLELNKNGVLPNGQCVSCRRVSCSTKGTKENSHLTAYDQQDFDQNMFYARLPWFDRNCQLQSRYVQVALSD